MDLPPFVGGKALLFGGRKKKRESAGGTSVSNLLGHILRMKEKVETNPVIYENFPRIYKNIAVLTFTSRVILSLNVYPLNVRRSLSFKHRHLPSSLYKQ